MAETKRPEGAPPDPRSVPTHAAPPSPRQSETQSQQTRRPDQPSAKAPSDSQKSQIRDYFRSQGKQPEDEIMDLQGLKLRLKDLD